MDNAAGRSGPAQSWVLIRTLAIFVSCGPSNTIGSLEPFPQNMTSRFVMMASFSTKGPEGSPINDVDTKPCPSQFLISRSLTV